MKKIKIPFVEQQTIEIDDKIYRITIEQISKELCICGCGESRTGKRSKYATSTCRMRVSRRNKKVV